mgnify:CR=1 FL=1
MLLLIKWEVCTKTVCDVLLHSGRSPKTRIGESPSKDFERNRHSKTRERELGRNLLYILELQNFVVWR